MTTIILRASKGSGLTNTEIDTNFTNLNTDKAERVSPTLVTPVLGTPVSVTLTNATGLPVATGISGLASGIANFLATPTSANLATALTDETGTGAVVFATSPTLVTPALGTPSSGTVTNLTGTASININGTVGDITATTGAFTTVTLTGDLRGPSTFIIDPAAVGDNTGVVVIKGNLQIDGTTTTVNSNTVTIVDKNIILGSGSVNDVDADGSGITVTSAVNKTFNWLNNTSAWTSSEHLNLASGKSYHINGTSVLNASTNTVASWAFVSTFSGVNNPTDVYFKPDGTKMFLLVAGTINQYTLSTPWDITSAGSLVSITNTWDTASLGFFFSPDGTKLVTCGQTAVVNAGLSIVAAEDRAYYLTLATAWDISSTITLVSSLRFGVGDAGLPAAETTPAGITFNSDGTIMYLIGATGDAVYQYTLSTAYNVSTATYLKQLSIVSVESGGSAIQFNSNGTKVYVTGTTNDYIIEYRLTTAWDIATAVYYDRLYVGYYDLTPQGIYIDEASNSAYMVGTTSDVVTKFVTNSPSVVITPALTNGTGRIDLVGDTRVKTGNLYVDKNIVAIGTVTLSGSLSSGAITSTGNIVGNQISTTTSALTLGGTVTTGATTITSTQTTGAINIGGAAGTGAITVGLSTAAQTLNLGTGATATATAKVVNIGSAGLSGSTTTVNIGSAVAGATSSAVVNGNVLVGTPTARTVSSATPVLQIEGSGAASWASLTRYSNDDNPPKVIFAKNRGTTTGAVTIVANADSLGVLEFVGADGVTLNVPAATIVCAVDGTPGVNDMPGRLVFNTTADGASTPTEAMRLSQDKSATFQARVGIGITPSATALIIATTATGGSAYNQVIAQYNSATDVTSQLRSFASAPTSAAAVYTVSNVQHFLTNGVAIGAGSTVTNQFGFVAQSGVTTATNNYGFYSDIASAANRFNFYAAGTAANFFAGGVAIGNTSPGQKLYVNGTGQTVAAITDAGLQNSTIFATSTGSASGDGGVLSIGTTVTNGVRMQWALKSLLNDGTANGQSDFVISGRAATADIALTERLRISSAGNVGISEPALAGTILYIPKQQTGATSATTISARMNPAVDVTTNSTGYTTFAINGVGTSTTNFFHYNANQGTLAGTAPTNQYGYNVSTALIGATNNYGFVGSIAAAANRYNFYANGTADNFFNGNVGIGQTPPVNSHLAVRGTHVSSSGFAQAYYAAGSVDASTTTRAEGYLSGIGTIDAAFTCPSLSHFYATQGTITGGSRTAVTSQFGHITDSTLTGATNNYGFYSNIAAGTNRFNFYANGTADNYFAGKVGIGIVPSASYNVRINKSVTGGGGTEYFVASEPAFQSDVTGTAYAYMSSPSTQATGFTLTNLIHFGAAFSTLGAGSSVANQMGFVVQAGITGATNNYGFRGRLAAASGVWNLYMDGTAANFFSGSLGIGIAPQSAAKANITSTSAGASTIALSLQNQSATVGSETALDFVCTAVDAGVRSAQITAINTDGSTGVNMVFKISNGAPAAECMRISSVGILLFNNTVVNGQSSARGIQNNSTTVLESFSATAGTSQLLTFTKSANATAGLHTLVSNADTLGQIRSHGSDGTTYRQATQIQFNVDGGTPSATSMPGRITFSTSASGSVSPTERVRIDSVGNVGIGGTASASEGLSLRKNITGAASGYAVFARNTVASDITGNAYGYATWIGTAASVAATSLNHFFAEQNTFAGTSVTNQYGFRVDASLTGATNNYGVFSNIASAANRYNFYAGGTADNYFAGNVGIGTSSPATKLDVNGTVTATGFSGPLTSCTVDGTDAVGFRNVPVNSQSTAYTTVLADSGKVIFHPSTDATARTFTIPANASVAYALGTIISFINMSSSAVTIAITTDTLYMSPSGSTGSFSLSQYGSATAIKMTATTWLITGSGLL